MIRQLSCVAAAVLAGGDRLEGDLVLGSVQDLGEIHLDLDADIADAAPLGLARVVREGNDVTVVTYGAQVTTAMDAALAAEDEGVSLEVIDLRSLSPIDYGTVAASVRRTGRLVVTHEASREAGVAAEVYRRWAEGG